MRHEPDELVNTAAKRSSPRQGEPQPKAYDMSQAQAGNSEPHIACALFRNVPQAFALCSWHIDGRTSS